MRDETHQRRHEQTLSLSTLISQGKTAKEVARLPSSWASFGWSRQNSQAEARLRRRQRIKLLERVLNHFAHRLCEDTGVKAVDEAVIK